MSQVSLSLQKFKSIFQSYYKLSVQIFVVISVCYVVGIAMKCPS